MLAALRLQDRPAKCIRTMAQGLAFLLAASLGLAVGTSVFASDAPRWWTARGVLDSNAVPNDHAPVNQGQAKWMATQAKAELDAVLASGSGPAIEALVGGFSPGGNNLPLNLGQLKFMAKPFYDRIREEGYAAALPLWLPGLYPWTDVSQDDVDFSIANLGQLKYVFSFDFDLCVDSDGDGMSDGFEFRNNLNINNPADAAQASLNPLAHGLTNLQLAQNPSVLRADNFSTRNDGIPDWWKVKHELPLNSPVAGADGDGDGYTTAQEYARGSDPNHNDEFGLSFRPVIIPCQKHGFDTYVQTTPPRRYSRQTEKWWDYEPGSLNLAAGENSTVIDRVTGEPTTIGDQLPPNTFLGWFYWPAPTPTATVRLGPVDVRQWTGFPQYEEWSDGSVSARGELFDEYTTDAFWATSCVALAAAPGVGGWTEAGWGEEVASAVLVNGELAIRVEKAELKFNLDTALGEMDLAWVEVFTPKDQPENKVYSVRTWTVPGADKEAVTNLNPLTYGLRVEGRYAIAIPSASLTQVQGLRTPTVGQFTPLADPHADGRVFIDTTEAWAGTLLQPSQFDRQRVRLTATVDLMGIPPERCRIRWAVYDPDDPASNKWADGNPAADGNDCNGPAGGDNSRLMDNTVYFSALAGQAIHSRDESRGAEVDRLLGVRLESADTPVADLGGGEMGGSVLLYLSDRGGDNYRVRVSVVVDDHEMPGGDTSGLWTMWRKRYLETYAMSQAEPDGAWYWYPSDDPSLASLQAGMQEAYSNPDPEKACYLDIVVFDGRFDLPHLSPVHDTITDGAYAYQWNRYLHTNLHASGQSPAHTPGFLQLLGVDEMKYLNGNGDIVFIGGSATCAPDAGVATGYLLTAPDPVMYNASPMTAAIHEVGHMICDTPIHDGHSPSDPNPRCAFEVMARNAWTPRRICEKHCFEVRGRVWRSWADHGHNELDRTGEKD